MSGLWTRYNALLDAQPLLTKALTSLTGFTVGDILAQVFIEQSGKPYDIMRTVRMGSFGFLLHGTTGHYFYGFLDSKLPGTAPMTVATKVAIDQTLWNPIFGCMFFGYLNLVEGKSFEDYKNKLKADLKTAVMGSWVVWVRKYFVRAHCECNDGQFVRRLTRRVCASACNSCAHYQLRLRPAQPASALHQLHSDRLQHFLVISR